MPWEALAVKEHAQQEVVQWSSGPQWLEALTALTSLQDFSLRSPLIDGHGNFGSVDADPPAAMRYTECKLRPLAEAMLLADIEDNTVRRQITLTYVQFVE